MSFHGGLLDVADDHSDDNLHAVLRYDEIANSGPAARPLDFPAPTVYRCERREVRARDHRSGTIHHLKNVIIRTEKNKYGRVSDTAYLVTKKIGKSVYGSVRRCIVLRRRQRSAIEERQDSVDSELDSEFVEWESTDLQAVIKASEWSKVHSMRGRHLEDPIREISAMQLVGNYHPHVCGALEILQDSNYLYTVMPYLQGGDLYERLRSVPTSRHSNAKGFDENQARTWFRQLMMGLFHLQKKGVCHRDISLENILLDEKDQLVLIDHGLCLRVPYTDPCNYGCVTDVSAGTCRRMMKSQGQGGKLMYAAPEIIDKSEAVDAFATDLWSAGVVLFVMLVGLAPFKWAHATDKRYAKISQGGLQELMETLDIPLSPEACDLLQGFFWSNPARRFTLAEVMDHPWVQGKQFVNVSLKPPARSQKRFTFSPVEKRKSSPQGCESLRSRFHSEFSQPRMVTPHL